jgi:hypothetical protein
MAPIGSRGFGGSGSRLLVGDEAGGVAVFAQGLQLSRVRLSDGPIVFLTHTQPFSGSREVFFSDWTGVLGPCDVPGEWRVVVPSLAPAVEPFGLPWPLAAHSVEVTAGSDATRCLLLSSACSRLFFICQGRVLHVMRAPAPVLALCAGNFTSTSFQSNDLHTLGAPLEPHAPRTSDSEFQCVALGAQDGHVYLLCLRTLTLSRLATFGPPVCHLARLHPHTDSKAIDSLVCAGHGPEWCVIIEGKLQERICEDSWIVALQTGDVTGDGRVDRLVVLTASAQLRIYERLERNE